MPNPLLPPSPYSGLLFLPSDPNLSWYNWCMQLFFEGDGVLTITCACVLLVVVYRLSGSPLDTSAEYAQVDREGLWADHNERFQPKNKRWLKDGPAGAKAWSGTGADAAIRKGAVLGETLPMPASRAEAMIATYETSDTVLASDLPGSKHGKGQGSAVMKDGRDQEASRQEGSRRGLQHALRNHSPPVKQLVAGGLCVARVGDPDGCTVQIVTVHDAATTYRSGLLQLSVEMVALATAAAADEGAPNQPLPCFYHVCLPGHDLPPGAELPPPPASFSMPALASLVAGCVAELPLTRYVLLGEGAGGNLCVRAASEDRQRDLDKKNSLDKSVRSGGLLVGLALINTEFDGPTIGDGINAALGGWFLRRGWLSSALARFGVQGWVAESAVSARERERSEVRREMDAPQTRDDGGAPSTPPPPHTHRATSPTTTGWTWSAWRNTRGRT